MPLGTDYVLNALVEEGLRHLFLVPGGLVELAARAAALWGKPGLVEIVVLSGFYQMFAAVNQGFDIRPGK